MPTLQKQNQKFKIFYLRFFRVFCVLRGLNLFSFGNVRNVSKPVTPLTPALRITTTWNCKYRYYGTPDHTVQRQTD